MRRLNKTGKELGWKRYNVYRCPHCEMYHLTTQYRPWPHEKE